MTIIEEPSVRVIDVIDVGRIVREIAAERPGHVASKLCRYFDEAGQPDCIIGHALHRLGIRAVDVFNLVIPERDDPNLQQCNHVFLALGITGDSAALVEVQAEQDSQKPWGEAVVSLGGQP